MKRHINITLLLLVILGLCCCNNNGGNSIAGGSESNKEIVENRTLEAKAEPFMEANVPTLEVTWKKGALFEVWDRSTTPKQYAFDGDSSSSGPLTWKSGQAEANIADTYAIYPWNRNALLSEDSSISLPYTASFTLNYPEEILSNLPMAAKGSGGTLNFKNLCGLLTIQISGEDAVKSISLAGRNGELLAPRANVTFSSKGEPEIAIIKDGTSTISVEFNLPVQLSRDETNPTTFYIPVAPASLDNGILLQYSMVKNLDYVVEIQNPIDIERGCVTVISHEPVKDPDKTVFDPQNNAVGCVRDAVSGKPIPGIHLTDGYQFTTTDKNGNYQFKLHPKARFVYLRMPADYKIPISASGNPLFYKTVDPGLDLNKNDFMLTPLPEDVDKKKFQMVMIGDPQCSTNTEVGYYRNTVADITGYMSEKGYFNSFAVTLGDNTFDSNATYGGMLSSMSNARLSNGESLPFFKAMGNHDHNGLETIENCTRLFESYFGPTDFSFDRGDVHVIVMDDVYVTSTKTKTTGKSNGYTCEYTYGFTDDEWKWIQQDLALVENPESKMVIFCAHIPFRTYTARHIPDVLKAFTAFGEAHLMIGHTHYSQNYIHTNYKCKGGNPIYEHIHGTACGAWWATSTVYGSDVIGGPRGYTVYQVDGAKVVDWITKGTGRDENFQLRVYDGNQEYSGAKNYPTYWYQNSTCGSAGITVKGNSALKDCFVAQVWDDDDKFWTVELYVDGKKAGDFKRLANGACTNAAASGWWFNVKNKNSTSYASTTASHYWYYKHTSLPAETKNWEVRVTHRFPNGGSRTFTCNTLTTDYSSF